MADKKTLFPVFEVPTMLQRSPPEKRSYRGSIFFDYELGDFRRDGAYKMTEADGQEAFEQWCIKTVLTERLAHLSYRSHIGAELINSFSQADAKAVEAALERTITEALMADARTEYVRGFVFDWMSDGLYCTFLVKGKAWKEKRLGVSYKGVLL